MSWKCPTNSWNPIKRARMGSMTGRALRPLARHSGGRPPMLLRCRYTAAGLPLAGTKGGGAKTRRAPEQRRREREGVKKPHPDRPSQCSSGVKRSVARRSEMAQRAAVSIDLLPTLKVTSTEKNDRIDLRIIRCLFLFARCGSRSTIFNKRHALSPPLSKAEKKQSCSIPANPASWEYIPCSVPTTRCLLC